MFSSKKRITELTNRVIRLETDLSEQEAYSSRLGLKLTGLISCVQDFIHKNNERIKKERGA